MNQKAKKYLSDFIFGAVDGLVTTFAVVSGVIGAGLSPTIILILGFANLFADGFPMGASNYLSTKSQNEMGQNNKNAMGAAVLTFSAFIIVGFLPLLAFVFDFGSANYKVTLILTGVAFIVIGYLKGWVTGSHRIFSAVQTFLIGSLAAFIAFAVGYILSVIVG